MPHTVVAQGLLHYRDHTSDRQPPHLRRPQRNQKSDGQHEWDGTHRRLSPWPPARDL